MNFIVVISLVIATILLAIVFEKIFQSPSLVAITTLGIFLIIFSILIFTSVITDISVGLIILILLTLIAFITAVIYKFFICICERFLRRCCNTCPNNSENIDDYSNNRNNDELIETTGNTEAIELRSNVAQNNRIKNIRTNRYRRF